MSDISKYSMGRVQNIHFVGIGGAGMCGIAEILQNLGYKISGSDLKTSDVTRHLENLGITVSYGHQPENVHGSDVVVVSSAVTANNPELETARKLRIPIIPRAEMLAEIMRFRQGIAVAGTHGKTTTTSLIASILAEDGLDPTFVIGGQLNSIGSNAKLGSGKYLVAEADESDASFMHLQPVIAVLTNIDADHLETYNNDFKCLSDTFLEFIQRLPFYGFAVVCMNDDGIQKVINSITKPYITYGIEKEADYIATDLMFDHSISSFCVSRREKNERLNIKLNLPGRHNVLNALAAISVTMELGISESAIINSLNNFQGIARRCNVLGVITIDGKKVTVIDDYAHHPSEIKAILNAVRDGWNGLRIVVIFQPHRYTRTRDLFEEFCDVLSDIEILFLLNIYPAGESPLPGVDSQSLSQAISVRRKVSPTLIENRSELYSILPDVLSDDDILLTLGAGDIGSLGSELVGNLGTSVH